jgi:sodium-dependent dicarboxylate transporter 2/3/5
MRDDGESARTDGSVAPEPEPLCALPEAIEAFSAAELRFDRWRRSLGLFVGPLVFVILLLLPMPGLPPDAARLAAILGWTLVWWVTEAIPIPITSLLAPALAVVCGVGTAAEMFGAFGDPIIFLFLGSFILAQAMLETGLDRRLAYGVLAHRLVGSSSSRILLAFAAISVAVSGWLSNTATTAMLYPIGMGVLAALSRLLERASGRRVDLSRLRYGTSLMLTLAWASSIGGIATPIGTPPNLIVLGQLDKLAGVRIDFFRWMLLAAPILGVMLTLLVLQMRFLLPPEVREIPGSREAIASERAALGPLSRGERNTLLAFGITVSLWILPGLFALVLGSEAPASRTVQRLLPESAVAILGAGLLFVLPVDWAARRFTVGWSEASRIDWGTLLLFGGGLVLGGAMFRTGLAAALGGGLVELTGSRSLAGLTFLFSLAALFLTETTSNTAAATMLAPLAIATAQAAGVSPIPPAIGVALSSSMAFMLPVSTPPNAIVYGSGCVPLRSMLRHGTLLDLASAIVVPTGVLVMCRLLGLA